MMDRAILAFLFFTGFMIRSQGQASNQQYIKWFAEANRFYDLDNPTAQSDEKALGLFMNAAEAALQYKTDYKIATDSYIRAGNIHQTYQRYTAANDLYHRALLLNTDHVSSEPIAYEAYLYLGSSFYFSNIIDSAQYYFEKASAIADNYSGPALPEQERLYNSLGVIYFESANYQQAKNYFERALLGLNTALPDNEETFVSLKSNIANCLLAIKKYDSALSIYKSLKHYSTHSDIILQNTAHTYFQMGMYDTALGYYKKLPTQAGLNRVRALNDVGRIYLNRGEWQQAENVFDSAILLNKKISRTIKNKEEALAYLYRGELAEKQGLIDEALTWCNEALQEVHLEFTAKNVYDVPADLFKTISPGVLFDVLQKKALLLFKKYRETKRTIFLTASLNAYRKAILTAKFIKKNFDNDEALIFFTRSYKSTYAAALEVAYEAVLLDRKYIDDYLFILENYKGRALYHNLQNIQLKTNAQVPDSIKQKEKEIKQLLAFYRTRISENTNERQAAKLQSTFIELQVSLSRLQKQYEQDEAYNLYRFQTEESESTLNFIQSTNDNNTAFISYFVDDSVIHALAINKGDFEISRIPADASFQDSFRTYIDQVYKQVEGLRYEGLHASAALYKALISPSSRIVDKCQKWVIIPNDILYYLPFEGLVEEPDSKRYVLFDKTVSYHYSFALLLKENNHRPAKYNNHSIGGFAPYSADDNRIHSSDLHVLPFSADEVRTTSGKIFLSSAATKNGFISEAPTFSIIHLATHGSLGADSSSNWIQFYPADSLPVNNRLFVDEIYNLDFHRTQLVVLSACETGSGVTISGEGLVSLSRAFMYAGSDGIISTLWKTEDRVTADLMQRLHFYLEKDVPPEEALQLAKKDFLNDNAVNARYKTPNYWSNFVYMGKISPQPESSSWWWIIAVILAAGAIVYLLVAKYKSA